MSLVRTTLKSYLTIFKYSTVHLILLLFLREIQFSLLQSWTLDFIIDLFFLIKFFDSLLYEECDLNNMREGFFLSLKRSFLLVALFQVICYGEFSG